jgi:ribosomal protein S27AE
MDIGSIFLILALLILVGLFISRPLFERKAIAVSQEEHEFSFLMAERDRILTALQELDFDHALGKIPEADYPAQRASLLQRGATILRQLDKYDHKSSQGDWESQIEAAIAARRRETGRQFNRRGPSYRSSAPKGAEQDVQESGAEPASQLSGTNVDDDLEAQIAARRRVKQGKAAGFCPQCGRAVQKSDKFCPNCGASVS